LQYKSDILIFFMKRLSIALVLFFSTHSVSAQQHNIWPFGYNYALDFNTTPLSISNIKEIPVHYDERMRGVFCDSMGELVIYNTTNNIYNKNHQLIKNGDSLAYYNGKIKSWFSTAIIPSTIKKNIFFILTIKEYERTFSPNVLGGLHYTKVDINANGGLGEVIEKQIPIANGKQLVRDFTIVQKKHSKGVWIIGGDSRDTIKVFDFDNDTFQLVHKFYFPNIILDTNLNTPFHNSAYQKLTASNSGKYILTTSRGIPVPNNNRGLASLSYLFNFNDSSGTVSKRKLVFYYVDTINNYNLRGGVITSNDSFIYLCGREAYLSGQDTPFYNHDVIRFTLNRDSIPLTQKNIFYKIPRTNGQHYINPAVGLDRKIYFVKIGTQNRHISRFENPEDIDNYHFKDTFIDFIDHPMFGALNEFPKTWNQPNVYFQVRNNLCSDTLEIVNLSDNDFVDFTFYINGKDSIKAFAANKIQYVPPKSGKYYIHLKAKRAYGYTQEWGDTIEFIKRPIAAFNQKANTGCQYIAFNFTNTSSADTVKPNSLISSHWSFGDGVDSVYSGNSIQEVTNSTSHTYTKSGVYSVRLVINTGFCSDTLIKQNTVLIKAAPRPGITITPTKGCLPLKIDIKRSFIDTAIQITYDFGDGSPPQQPTIQNAVDAPTQYTYTSSGTFMIKQSIEGVTGCITKDSAKVVVLKGFDGTSQPLFLFATVVGDTTVSIAWQPFNESLLYAIQKSTNKVQWKTLLTVPTSEFSYIDKNVTPQKERYWYRIVATDTCDKNAISNIGSTLLLSGKTFGNDYSVVEWSSYEDWQGGVLNYQVEIFDNTNATWNNITSVNQTVFMDNSFSDDEARNEKCYRIAAIENGGVFSKSISNTLCLPYSPVLWIPNSFTPNSDGLNDAFSITTLGIKELEFTIYNTYGEKLFTCGEPACSWNGEYKNIPVSEGVYSYLLKARTVTNKIINERGTITLLR